MDINYKYRRNVISMDDDGLEEFVRQWVLKKAEYHGVERFDAPGDLGRDVVGFLTSQKHEGEWHNYQCKQYGSSIKTEVGLRELGKILYNASLGHFTAPTRYYYVAPRGLNRNLRDFISNPKKLKAKLIEKWDDYCATKIVENLTIPLTGDIQKMVENWNYENVFTLGIEEILADDAAKAVLYKWFGADPGPAPAGVVPSTPSDVETPYITQLYVAYGERENCRIANVEDLDAHLHHKGHLARQRERFFDADAFTRFYRDNTDVAETDAFKNDIFHGVVETYFKKHGDSLAKIDAVMERAAIVQPAGLLARHARTPVKQGLCHHFVNDGEWEWSKK